MVGEGLSTRGKFRTFRRLWRTPFSWSRHDVGYVASDVGQDWELRRSVSKRSVDALREGQLITGRQIVYMVSDRFKLSDRMSMVYSITGIVANTGKGDPPTHVCGVSPITWTPR